MLFAVFVLLFTSVSAFHNGNRPLGGRCRVTEMQAVIDPKYVSRFSLLKRPLNPVHLRSASPARARSAFSTR